MKNFVPFTSDDEVAAIAEGLLNRTLPKPAWTHAAHFAATLWLLTTRPEFDLFQHLPDIIRAYNETVGTANTNSSGYHETITQVSIRAACWYLRSSPRRPLYATCNALMASPLGNSNWLLDYWSRPRLFSVEARRAWLDPDIQELPF
jgi:hypothetical protein